MAKDTKERILETALEMFSQNGYNGTNIRELTAALGLVKSSIYKHLEMFTHLFSGMMDKGLIRRNDPAMLAFAYTAPISALIHLCDREPEKTEEALKQVEAFSRHFIKAYGRCDAEHHGNQTDRLL